MIVYHATKQQFVSDAANGIEDIVRDSVSKHLRIDIKPESSEYNSWRNSLGNAMFHVMNSDRIPSTASVAIEYSIPRTKNRIDFIVSGLDAEQKERTVIIELKQWTQVGLTDKDAVIETPFQRHITQTLHPSYQAWSYAMLLYHFNEIIHTGQITLHPCAYLHNLTDDLVICNSFYKTHLEAAPVFCKGDRDQLQDFIAQHIKHGDTKNILQRIDTGNARPSKELADMLSSMMQGNQEFILIDEQKLVFENALSLIKKSSDEKHVLIVKGGPGTGKSVVAINLLVEAFANQKNARYVTKNATPRDVYRTKLSGTMNKNEIAALFQGSGAFTKNDKNDYDALIIDEAHRLNEKSGMFRNLGENQIKELIHAAKVAVFFIDENQRVTWQDIGEIDEIKKWAKALGATVHESELESQFRCNGSDGYLAWVDHNLQIRDTANPTLDGIDYDFKVFDSPSEMRQKIIEKNTNNKARMIAGYCWEWISRRDKQAHDIVFPEHDFAMQWNLTSDVYAIAPNSVDQVGCIHTCQGLDFEYVGVIIGPDLIVRDGVVQTHPDKRARSDKSLNGYKKDLKAGVEGTEQKADMIIRNTYRTLMTRGLKGCYLYSEDEETREYFKDRMSGVEY